MFQRFLRRVLGLFLILQTVLMFIGRNTSSGTILSKILVVEAIIFLSLSPWFLKVSWLTAITLVITGVSIILMLGGFAFIAPYYLYLVFLPAIAGIIVIIASYISKPHKS